MHSHAVPIATLLVALAGCSAGDSATQQVAIRTVPAGAACTVTRARSVGLGHLVTGGFAAVVEDAVKSTDFRYDPAGASVTLSPK